MPTSTATQPPPNTATLLELLHRMLLIRRMEERLGEVVKSGELPGSVHLYIGQEAVAVRRGSAATRHTLEFGSAVVAFTR